MLYATKPLDLPTADCDIRPSDAADPGCDMGVAIPTGGGGAGAGCVAII